MAPNRRERDWPVPDAIHQIQIALIRENESETNLLAVSLNQGLGEVTLADRDGAVHLLRFLKFWFNLQSTVFLTAVNILDRFLTKMKVQRRYLTCLVVSCFSVAAEVHQCNIDPKNLVFISQSKCSVKDMERMSEIIRKKLDLGPGKQLMSVFNYLNHFQGLLESVAAQFKTKGLFETILKTELLLTHLEVIMCNSECASAKPVVIALALIQTELERFLSSEIPSKSSYYSFVLLQLLTTVVDLQLICLIVPMEFTSCHKNITKALKEYDDHSKTYPHQHLQWRYSSRVLYTTKPSWNYFTTLHTILEE
ncbi:hypothetical protein ILUMI_12879 [Ignelater luminosus]|uniref:Cyclin-like domain-containing protein n=1 Tax=Ignelater luminosus TaxID=2038154 RepID=A0A8K0CXN4_IGNLU|nr:hypothetical protein ILUMI_12879 [Ignelater luminosus]